jgi:PAS domain S-box-containing protein
MGHLEIRQDILCKLEALAAQKGVTTDEVLETYLANRHNVEKLVAEHATDLVCLHEPDGTFIYVSPSSLSIIGYLPEEVIGKNPYEFFHPDDLEQIQASHSTSLTGEQVSGLAYRFRCKNGNYVWLETRTNPVLDEAGNVIKLVTVSRDISEQRRIEEQLKQERDLLSSIMETSPSGIVVVEKSGQITFANQRAQAIMGITQKDFTGRTTYDSPAWAHTDYDGNPWPDEKQPFVRVMQTKKPVWEVRHAITLPDGTRTYLSINGAPILDADGEVSKVVFTIEDYTRRKIQEDELAATLAREKHANETKSNFISLVSHEFRTPMTIIMTSTHILEMKLSTMSHAEVIDRLDKIRTQVHRLNNLISDVTFINKDELVGQPIQPVRINLPQFFSQIADEIQIAHDDHQPIKLIQAHPSETVMLDLSLMQQIFINLLSNAVKYSPPDSTVTCQYSGDKHSLSVVVKDEGIGIPQEDQLHLFEVFHRAANAHKIPGTGLGLAIVKRAVDKLGGTITVDSQVGAGSTFTITLPLN